MKTGMLIFSFYFSAQLIFGQSLNKSSNVLRAGDYILKQQVDYKEPGASGQDVIWNFSNTRTVNDKYQLVYFHPAENDTLSFVGFEHNTQYHYKYSKDTIWLAGYENSNTKVTYNKPEIYLPFPFSYGDSLKTTFSGSGLYSNRVKFGIEGSTRITIDAYGKLITPDMDTLHVIRLYKEKKIHDVSSKEKTIHLKCYQWYSSGNRYPVFESTESYSVLKDSIKTNFQTSFFISFINREELNVRFDETNKYTNETDADLINCSVYPNPVKTDLTFNYELTVNAKVSFLLCDMQGRPWYSEKDIELEIGKHQQNISMTELWLGNYALYITVNGKTYKYTVIKQ